MECIKVVDLKALAKERGLQGYSKLKKAKLITFLQNNLQPTPAPRTKPARPTRPSPPPPTWEPVDDRPPSVRLDQIGQDSHHQFETLSAKT